MTFTMTSNVEDSFRLIDGFCIFGTGQTLSMAVFFMFFSGMIVTDTLYLEFRSDMRWRLMASPQPFKKFVTAAILSSIIVSVFNSVVVLAFGALVLNATFDLIMVAVVFITMGIFATLFGVLCFLLFPKKGTTTAVMMAFAFVQLLALNFGMMPMPAFGEIGIASFLPLVAGIIPLEVTNGMSFSTLPFDLDIYTMEQVYEQVAANANWHLLYTEDGFVVRDMLGTSPRMAWLHYGILAGYTALVGIAVAVLGRKRSI